MWGVRVINAPEGLLVLLEVVMIFVLPGVAAVVGDLRVLLLDSEDAPESGELDVLLSRRCSFSPHTRPCFWHLKQVASRDAYSHYDQIHFLVCGVTLRRLS